MEKRKLRNCIIELHSPVLCFGRLKDHIIQDLIRTKNIDFNCANKLYELKYSIY